MSELERDNFTKQSRLQIFFESTVPDVSYILSRPMNYASYANVCGAKGQRLCSFTEYCGASRTFNGTVFAPTGDGFNRWFDLNRCAKLSDDELREMISSWPNGICPNCKPNPILCCSPPPGKFSTATKLSLKSNPAQRRSSNARQFPGTICTRSHFASNFRKNEPQEVKRVVRR